MPATRLARATESSSWLRVDLTSRGELIDATLELVDDSRRTWFLPTHRPTQLPAGRYWPRLQRASPTINEEFNQSPITVRPGGIDKTALHHIDLETAVGFLRLQTGSTRPMSATIALQNGNGMTWTDVKDREIWILPAGTHELTLRRNARTFGPVTITVSSSRTETVDVSRLESQGAPR